MRSDGKQTQQKAIIKSEAGGCGIYQFVASALPAQPSPDNRSKEDDPGPVEKHQEQGEGASHEGGGESVGQTRDPMEHCKGQRLGDDAVDPGVTRAS
jgi:hypothetical protein